MFTNSDYETDYIKIYIPSYNKNVNNINKNNHKNKGIDQLINSNHSRFPYRISLQEPHILYSPVHKIMIRGYSGYLPNTKDIIGVPIIPNIKKQLININSHNIHHDNDFDGGRDGDMNRNDDINNDNAFQRNILSSPSYSKQQHQQQQPQHHHHQQQQQQLHQEIDIIERYNRSVQLLLLRRGQTQEQLFRIVQSKISESDITYAQLLIRIKKLLEAFDYRREGVINQGKDGDHYHEEYDNDNDNHDDDGGGDDRL
jgi:hypothetical protein